jgi:DICT domain-containing protein
VPDAHYYRQQAERFSRIADQCSIAELVPYYQKLAFDCLAQAVRAETAYAETREKAPRRRKRAAQR